MKKYTKPERQLISILENIGYSVISWQDHREQDPSNVIYSQMPICRLGGQKAFVADFAFPNAQIDIEVDGEYWHKNAARIHDCNRDHEIKQLGWSTIRLKSNILNYPEIVQKNLRVAIWTLFDL